MEMPKPTDADKDYFRSLVPDHPAVEVKPMFGNLAAFVNGNMFMGLFGADVGLKLPDPEREQLREHGAGDFGPSERPMREYVSLPRDWRSDPGRASIWTDRALRHVSAMPPKKK